MAKFEVNKFGVPDKSGGLKDVFGISPNMELQYNRVPATPAFNPLDYSPHNYWDSRNTTVVSTTTTALDYILEHDLVNPAASNQPVLNSADADFGGEDSFTFDGTSDHLKKDIVDYRLSDSSGEIHIVVEATGESMYGLGYADNVSNSNLIRISGGLDANFAFIRPLTPNNQITDNAGAVMSDYTTAMLLSIISIGSSYRLFINGTEKTVSMGSGTNTGEWFSSFADMDALAIGATLRSSPLYSAGKWAATGVFPLLSDGDRVLLMDGLKTRYGII